MTQYLTHTVCGANIKFYFDDPKPVYELIKLGSGQRCWNCKATIKESELIKFEK